MDSVIKYVMLTMLLSSSAMADYNKYYEDMEASNQAMRTCLLAHGYEGSVFFTYSFEKASACFHDWKSGQLKKDYIRTQMWLEQHPWYKGTDWNWEQISKEYPGNRNRNEINVR